MGMPALGKVKYRKLDPGSRVPVHAGSPFLKLLESAMSDDVFARGLIERLRQTQQQAPAAFDSLIQMGAPTQAAARPTQMASGVQPGQYQPSGIAGTVAAVETEEAISQWLLDEMRRIAAADQPGFLESMAPFLLGGAGALTGGLVPGGSLAGAAFGSQMGGGLGELLQLLGQR